MIPYQRLQRIVDHLTPIQSDNKNLQADLCSATSTSPLQAYRKNASFDVNEMIQFLEGPFVEFKKRVFERMMSDPLFRQPIIELDLPRDKLRELCYLQMRRLIEWNFINETDHEERPLLYSQYLSYIQHFDPSLTALYSLHTGLFTLFVKKMGSKRHMLYVEKARSLEIIGCLALTELSHGTNVKGIGTTATFEQSTQGFILHTPDYLATKWWIGVAGKVANFAIIMANLILKGKNYGVHPFLVPIRDLQSHLAISGVLVGDVGEKIGQNSLSNAFIAFNNYWIPRENLLNRIGDVTSEGVYTSENVPSSQRFAQTLLPLSGGRVEIALISMVSLKIALTIAIRYSAVRRQFGSSKKEENAVIEYPLQQYRLFPFLAECYAVSFFSEWVRDVFVLNRAKWYKNEHKPLSEALDQNLLPELHCLISGIKPISTWCVRDGIQSSRECCGGHGYAASNRFGILRQDHEPTLTYEGDNYILIQQTSKFILETYRTVVETNSTENIKDPLGTFYFMRKLDAISNYKCEAKSIEDFFNPEVYMSALESRLVNQIKQSTQKLVDCIGENQDPFDAWNNSQVFYSQNVAKSYMELSITRYFLKEIEKAKPTLQPVLQKLCHLYALTKIEKDLGTFRENDFLSSLHGDLVKKGILQLLSDLKNDAVSLVDSFNIPDKILFAPIGQSDGEVYKNFYGQTLSNRDAFTRVDWWYKLKVPLKLESKK